MNWIAIALIAYFLVSLEVILDKFLLTSEKVSHPAIYAFYSGLLSLATLFLAPFGARWINFNAAITYILFGAVFVYGILFLFYAIKRSEASRVIPVVGAIVPIVTYILAHFFSAEYLKIYQIFGMLVLVFGGLLISFDLPLKVNPHTFRSIKKFLPLSFFTSIIFKEGGGAGNKKFFDGFYYSIIAGVLLAVAFTAFKNFYRHGGGFINVFVWTRLGLVVGALSLLLNPAWRKIILHSSKNFKNPEKEHVHTSALFVGNKALGGLGSILTNYAISLGSVTIVNAMVSIEYVFIFLMGLIFSVKFPKLFQEKGSFWDVAQKVAAIVIITAGIIIVSLKKI